MSAEQYSTSSEWFMSKLPRFGHSSDFSKLASSNQEEQADYVVGILSVSFFILSFAIFWGAVVITCKCMGKRRVGLCAGRVQVVADKKGQFHPPTYLWKFRCCFIALGCIMCLLGVALVGPGLHSLETTSMSTRNLNRDVKELITQGLLIMDKVKRVKWNMDTMDVEAVLHVKDVCPNFKNSTFASDKKLRSSINGLTSEFDEINEYLEETDGLEAIREHIDLIMDGTEYVETAVTTAENNDWIVRMYALVLNGLVIFMILAAASSGRKCNLPALSCMSEFFILPLFVLAIAGSWFATAVLAFASVSNADFCSGNALQSGSAGTVMNIFKERGITEDDIIYESFSYYQSECETQDPVEHLYKYEDGLQHGVGLANDFLKQADEIGPDKINEQCGADASHIIEIIGLIKDNLGILLDSLRSAFELASCTKMRPIYSQAFEGTTCTDSSGSLTLLFFIFLSISILGLVMICLRSAMFPFKKVYSPSPSSELDYDEQSEWDEYQAYLKYMKTFVNIWGGNAADEDSATKDEDTSETSSVPSEWSGSGNSRSNTSSYLHHSSENSLAQSECSGNARSNTSSYLHRLRSPSTLCSNEYMPDEEAPLSPHAPALELVLDKHSPLSPESDSFSPGSMNKRIDTHQNKTLAAGDRHDNDECMPLSPQSPTIYVRSGMSKLQAIDTFRRWRHHDGDEVTNDEELPETPLMISPTDQKGGVNYFDNMLSPLRRAQVKRE